MRKINLFLMVLSLLTVCISSCGGDDDDKSKKDNEDNPQTATLDKTSITLYVDETSLLTYSGGNCTWSSDNDLIAKVENGTVTGKHVGMTTIHANDATCTVTVRSRNNSYVEPLMLWGASQATIKSKMSSYTLKSSNATTLIYNGKGKVVAWAYQFENNALITSGMILDLYSSTDITDFTTDRYVVIDVDKSKNEVYFISPDTSMLIALKIEGSAIYVIYMENNTTKAPYIVPFKGMMPDDMKISSGNKLSDSEVEKIFNRFSMAM